MIFYILFHHIIIVKLQILSLRRNLKKDLSFISIRTGANTALDMTTRISLVVAIEKTFKYNLQQKNHKILII